MEQQDVYRDLSRKLMMENSRVLPLIWRVVCSDDEALIVNRLPATVEELAREFSKTPAEMQGIIDGLFHRGAVFDFVKDGVTFYRGPGTSCSSTTPPSCGQRPPKRCSISGWSSRRRTTPSCWNW